MMQIYTHVCPLTPQTRLNLSCARAKSIVFEARASLSNHLHFYYCHFHTLLNQIRFFYICFQLHIWPFSMAR